MTGYSCRWKIRVYGRPRSVLYDVLNSQRSAPAITGSVAIVGAAPTIWTVLRGRIAILRNVRVELRPVGIRRPKHNRRADAHRIRGHADLVVPDRVVLAARRVVNLRGRNPGT